MADRILPTEAQAPAPTTHTYNDATLSPVEFLRAVMHATHQPMSIRIEAARALLPYTHPYPRSVVPPSGKIVIPPLSYEPWSEVCSPWPREEGHADDPTRNHSENLGSPNIPITHNLEAPAPENLEMNSNPSYLPDYSLPPHPAVFEAARKYGLPEPHLCSYCGHWLTTTYPDCICGTRDPSKLN